MTFNLSVIYEDSTDDMEVTPYHEDVRVDGRTVMELSNDEFVVTAIRVKTASIKYNINESEFHIDYDIELYGCPKKENKNEHSCQESIDLGPGFLTANKEIIDVVEMTHEELIETVEDLTQQE